MLRTARDVYTVTRKKHDLVFNLYVMRPLAAVVVAVLAPTRVTPNQITLLNLFVFVVAAALLPLLPTYAGGLVAIAVLYVSYCLDCVDGMLARYKKIASREGHLFDFFTDEVKALLLAALLSLRLYRTGGWGVGDVPPVGFVVVHWPPLAPSFLVAGIAAAVVVASATSLTNFVRRPELTGKAGQVEAHYETVDHARPATPVARAAQLVMQLLRFLNHYPSHIWVFAAAAAFDLFFWMYLTLNLLYLARGWLGLVLRFGKA
jgi:CDP-alcohol phosphatidyltransferase